MNKGFKKFFLSAGVLFAFAIALFLTPAACIKSEAGPAGPEVAVGIDVSKYQGGINWQQVRNSGVKFAMIRVGTTKKGLDEQFINNINGANAAGVRTGIYIYSYATTPEAAAAEANQVLAWIAPYTVTFPIAIDIEDSSQKGLNPAQLQAIADTRFSDGAFVVELDKDMITVKGEPHMLVPGEKIAEGTGYENHGFFEASSMRKIGDKYYFIYSSSVSHELCYAVSDYPDKEFTYGGVIVSNGDIGYKGNTRPRAMMGNNHGSIIEINKKWYIFYHRQTHGTESSRQGCAEQIRIADDGSIAQVEITSCGLNGGALTGKGTYSAAIACNLMCAENDSKIVYGQSLKDSQPYIFQKSADREEESEHYIANVFNGVIAGFKYFDCRNGTKITVEAMSYGSGKLLISLDSEDSEPVGEISFAGADDKFAEYGTNVNIPDGIHGLFFRFIGDGKIDFKNFTFE